MEDDGQSFVYQRLIAPTAASVKFAKALDRSVTGSINELVKFATFYLEDGDTSLYDVGFKLNDVLLSALGSSKSHPYGKPKEAFKALGTSYDGSLPSSASSDSDNCSQSSHGP